MGVDVHSLSARPSSQTPTIEAQFPAWGRLSAIYGAVVSRLAAWWRAFIYGPPEVQELEPEPELELRWWITSPNELRRHGVQAWHAKSGPVLPGSGRTHCAAAVSSIAGREQQRAPRSTGRPRGVAL